uniref:Uncharacterized protein n=1 Tax=Pithovirus LCPAC401 TaxID=2506595 RepID=A0A481ZAW1_9VIRU|nr:MAG: uncharacterized protein LCPAC401_01000 [Pithovirus LCPAC401]
MIEHFKHTYIMFEKCYSDIIDYFLFHHDENYFTNENDRIDYRMMIERHERDYSSHVFGFEQTFKMCNQKLYHCDSRNIEIYHKMKNMTTKKIIKVMIDKDIQDRAYYRKKYFVHSITVIGGDNLTVTTY